MTTWEEHCAGKPGYKHARQPAEPEKKVTKKKVTKKTPSKE